MSGALTPLPDVHKWPKQEQVLLQYLTAVWLVTQIRCFWHMFLKSTKHSHTHAGHAVSQVVETLRYKPEGRGFASRWCIGIFHWHNPSGRTMALELTQPLTEISTRNIPWGKGVRCLGLTTLPPSSADIFKIWEPQLPGTLRVCPGLQWDCFAFFYLCILVLSERQTW
jgi:hypothetical protein